MAKEPTKLDLQEIVDSALDPAINKTVEALKALIVAARSTVDLVEGGASGIVTAGGKTADAWLDELDKFADSLERETHEVVDAAKEVLPG